MSDRTLVELLALPSAASQELPHVYPASGREHDLTADCWCCPREDRGVIIHRDPREAS